MRDLTVPKCFSLARSRSRSHGNKHSVFYQRNPHLDRTCYLCESPEGSNPPIATNGMFGHTNGNVASNSCARKPTLRSLSTNSMNSEGSVSDVTSLMDQDGIIKLTRDVRKFKETLGQLKRIFNVDKEKLKTSKTAAHDHLSEVLRILQDILLKHPKLKSTELLVAAKAVIHHVKAFRFEDEKSDASDFLDTVDQLALAFSSCVSEFLMGDLDSSDQNASKTRSCDNLLAVDADAVDSGVPPFMSMLTPREIDSVMMKSPQGVEVALHHAKMWSKYAKDVATYIDKNSSLEAEHARNIAKLVQTMRPVLKEEDFMPFKSIYCTALDQDVENANTMLAACNLLQGQKFIEPLMARRSEHEKMRKHLKETWHRELKRMHEAVSNLRKSKALYIHRQQEYEKAKDSLLKTEQVTQGSDIVDSNKIDKKRKLKEDNLQKALEAETTYKACVIEANERQQQLEKVKGEVLKEVRELIYQCDQTMKAVTVSYFQLRNTVSGPAPVQYQTLCESSRLYEPGQQYMERVKRQQMTPLHHSLSLSTMAKQPMFVFEPFNNDRIFDKSRNSNDSGMCFDDNRIDQLRPSRQLSASNVKSWNSGSSPVNGGSDDSDSIGSNSNRSQDASPSASPKISSHNDSKISFASAASSGDELENDLENDRSGSSRQAMSKAAVTHTFRKLKTPSKCRECDSYVYFHGTECTECGLSCHKKCLEALAIQCGHKRLPRKMTTFGVELATHLLHTRTSVPFIVTKCISEIESRGIDMKGIYRISGVKSKVEKLCQTFESGMELVDASEIRPCVIANVLKLYLRQLPEPLLTFRLYKDFINVTKLLPDTADAVEQLKKLVHILPIPYYKTLAYIMYHLKRVADLCEQNNMPPSNLGIVFGPTILRTSEGAASLNSLVDTMHQAKVMELMIVHSTVIFGPEDKKFEFQSQKKSNDTQKDVDDKNESIDGCISSANVDELNSSPDDWRDITDECNIDLSDSLLRENLLDSPPVQHPAFSRQSASRIEHRRYNRNLASDGFNFSELCRDSSLHHDAVMNQNKIPQRQPVKLARMRPVSPHMRNKAESKGSRASPRVTEERKDDAVDENLQTANDSEDGHQKLTAIPPSYISARNAHLKNKFFSSFQNDSDDSTGSQSRMENMLSKSQSASAVTGTTDSNFNSTVYSSRTLNRLRKGVIYIPKNHMVSNEESIAIGHRIASGLNVIKQKGDEYEKRFTSTYTFNDTRQSSALDYGAKSPNPLPDLCLGAAKNLSESELANNHRTLARACGSSFHPASSSDSLSSERSSRHSLKSKAHQPVRKSKSSGSSDGYNEDEEYETSSSRRRNSTESNVKKPKGEDKNNLTFV